MKHNWFRLFVLTLIAIGVFSIFVFTPPKTYAACGGGSVYFRQMNSTCTRSDGSSCSTPSSTCHCTYSCPSITDGISSWSQEYCSDASNSTGCNNLNTPPGANYCKVGSCTWSSSTPTPTNPKATPTNPKPPAIPAAPTIITSSCTYPSQTATTTWSAVTGATYYSVRVNDQTYSWDGLCSTPGDENGGNYCDDYAITSNSWTGIAGHSYGWWVHACNTGGCSASTYSSFTCLSPTPTPTNTPTPTPTPVIFSYYKMKDTSFYRLGSLSQNFPPVYSAFDSDDTSTGGYFNQGQAGTVITSGGSLSAGDGGTAISGSSGNARNWTATNYSGGNPFTSSSFINYVKAKKDTTAVSTISDLPTSGSGGTYSITSTTPITLSGTQSFRSNITILVNGNLTISTSDIGKDNVVFLVTGDVTINGSGTPATFNTGKRGFAVISAGTIKFDDDLTEADGLFVGKTINFDTGSKALKIVGNVSSETASTFSRDRGTNQPSMFIMYDPRHYQSVVDRISTVKSSWTQIQ